MSEKQKATASALFTKHGMSTSPEYNIWRHIIRRCYSPTATAYPRYGAKGVRVCDKWRAGFVNFYNDMGPRPSPKHSIDRIENSKGYEPGNCRWATRKEQSINRSNVKRAMGAKEVILCVENEKRGMKRGRLTERLRRDPGRDPLDNEQWRIGQRGEANCNAKLNSAQVAEIRAGEFSTKELATKFGISTARVRQIKRGVGWRHIGTASKDDRAKVMTALTAAMPEAAE